MKPVAKSVYQNNKVVRLNGSLNGTLGLSGLNMMESSKQLHSNNFQFGLSSTYNLNILTNSFNLGNKGLLNKTMDVERTRGDLDTLNTSKSPRAIRSIYKESNSAFSVIPNTKIPDLSESRREEREERLQNLLKKPDHKIKAR